MEKTLYNKNGDIIAYISNDFHNTIYLWEGKQVAYIYEDQHIYGINGRHLGWFIDEIIYNNDGERVGFTNNSCPVSVAKETVKPEKYPKDEIQPRWKAPPLPKTLFDFANEDLSDFLKEGRFLFFREEVSQEAEEEM
jgi:hypothetical protein